MISKKRLRTAVLLLLVSHIASILSAVPALAVVGRVLVAVDLIAICLVAKGSRRCLAALGCMVLQLVIGLSSYVVWGPAQTGEEIVVPAFALAIVVTVLDAFAIRFLFSGLGEQLREQGAEKAAQYGATAAGFTVARCVVTALFYLSVIAAALMTRPTGVYVGGSGMLYLLLTLASGILAIVEYIVHLLYFSKCLKGLKEAPSEAPPQ